MKSFLSPPAEGGGRKYYQLIGTTAKSPGKYFYTPSSILIAICKVYG
ncbi:MAG: hypothetical protein LBR79_04700 [Oscillospiraceae bacterium]|nr:hypothetical protein [Oscillospiraceae bacterium]